MKEFWISLKVEHCTKRRMRQEVHLDRDGKRSRSLSKLLQKEAVKVFTIPSPSHTYLNIYNVPDLVSCFEKKSVVSSAGTQPRNIANTVEDQSQALRTWNGISFVPLSVARAFVRLRYFKDKRDFRTWIKEKKKPGWIPSNPASDYKDSWISWDDFLTAPETYGPNSFHLLESPECTPSEDSVLVYFAGKKKKTQT